MNTKANRLLESLRESLETQLTPEPQLTEAEQKFCEDSIAFIRAADYELEGHEDCGPVQFKDALEAIARDDENLAPKVAEFFEMHKGLFSEA